MQQAQQKQYLNDQFQAARLEARKAFRNRFPNPSDPNSQLAAVWAYRMCCGQVVNEIRDDDTLVDERDMHMGSSNTSFCWVVALREICRIRSEYVMAQSTSTQDIPSVQLLEYECNL